MQTDRDSFFSSFTIHNHFCLNKQDIITVVHKTSLKKIAMIHGLEKDFQEVPVTIQFGHKVQNKSQEYLLGSKGGRYVELTTLPPSCADCLEILGASNSCSTKSLTRPIMG